MGDYYVPHLFFSPLPKLTIGTSKSYIRGKSLSVDGHTHLISNITDLRPEIDSLKTSVSNGKSAVASAITDMGISTSATASFTEMANNIRGIPSGTGGYFRYDGTLREAYIETMPPGTTSMFINIHSYPVDMHFPKNTSLFYIYPQHSFNNPTNMTEETPLRIGNVANAFMCTKGVDSTWTIIGYYNLSNNINSYIYKSGSLPYMAPDLHPVITNTGERWRFTCDALPFRTYIIYATSTIYVYTGFIYC